MAIVLTRRIRFTPEEGGHEGLINASDFNPLRHIPLDVEEEEKPAPRETQKAKPAKAGA